MTVGRPMFQRCDRHSQTRPAEAASSATGAIQNRLAAVIPASRCCGGKPAFPGISANVAAVSRSTASQSSREAGYSASRHSTIASYHGYWEGQKYPQARPSARTGRIAGRSGTPSGSRHSSSSATSPHARPASSSWCGIALPCDPTKPW
jgi:hypothetical protein